jgi:hypothetical protein
MKNPMFRFGNKKAALVLAATALIAAGCGLKQPANNSNSQPAQEQSNNAASAGNSTSTSATNPAGSTWQGALELSDNAASGNYTITVNGHKIYLKTGRDFSKLVGKEVNVSYTGSLTNFTLNDITAQ